MCPKIFSNTTFLGEHPIKSICREDGVLSNGTVLQINNKSYCIGNIMVKSDGTIIIEVY
ncbi:hypothetical protein [Bacillus cereus]|uniref:hypothetical protein n=1 Tax=Bacillus cereus TaxID=1396 RepID=UPI00192D6346|nr:hypothetical protein [Bacillus cereus]MDA2329451.1 hypothetical protein [Bacillus cereus]MDA2335163.1 hypothetical protein [Bacillus cereus]